MSKVGAMHAQVQYGQATNQNISSSVLVIETESRFKIEIKSEQKEAQETSPSDSISESTSDSLTISMLGSKGYFRCLSKRTDHEVLQDRGICAKGDQGKAGYHERDNHHTAATAALQHKFWATKHFVPRNLEGEADSSSKYWNIESEY